jgi:hydrogenase/urease accessory protein HupE
LIVIRLVFVIVSLLFLAIPVQADIIFPARLELKEVEPAVFEVNFNLPIISGKKLKARPLLPDVCQNLTEREVLVSPSSYRETWRISCQPEHLYGERIAIEGLLGTQVDVMVFIETLDGRQYSVIMKPSRSSYTIPAPPTLLELWTAASFEGIRRFLSRPDLLVLLLLVALLKLNIRILLPGFASYFIGHSIGQLLAGQNWLTLSTYLPPIIILGYVLLPLLDMANGQKTRRIWKTDIWIPSLIFGLFYGGAFPDTLALEGLSRAEQQAALLFLNMGIAVGIVLGYLLMFEFRQVVFLFKGKIASGVLQQRLGYGIGFVCFGLLLYQASALLFVPNILPQIPVRYFVFPLILGFWLWRTGWENRSWIMAIFVMALGIGMIPGLVGIRLPLNSALVLGSIVLFAVPLLFHWQISQKIGLPIAVFALMLQGWSLGFYVKENMTLPIANAMGAALIITYIFLISITFVNEKFQLELPGRLRVLAGIIIGLTIIWRVGEYRVWYDSGFITDWALGLVTIPLLSIILLVAALVTWPKKRIILEKLQLTVRKPVSHWIYLSFAFFLIPIGTIQLENPFFTPRPLAEGEAKRVLQQVLSNTFHAFNIPDEQKLYDQLAQNVSGELITNIYLDSRRRLNAGVRTGGEVTVREVKVLSARQVGEGFNPSSGYSYESKWAVTARVRHLQHVHHRQNIYNGIIRIKIDERSWKIAAIELLSEDRVIIPGSAG